MIFCPGEGNDGEYNNLRIKNDSLLGGWDLRTCWKNLILLQTVSLASILRKFSLNRLAIRLKFSQKSAQRDRFFRFLSQSGKIEHYSIFRMV